MPQIVVLWTDALIFLLLGLTVGFALFARRRPHLSGPWQRVARSRTGMGAGVVLGAFVLIGLLDSVHFHPPLAEAERNGANTHSRTVLSLFDLVVAPLRENGEKTYSAPLATHLYTKENLELPDGRTVREYPRLQFGGAHLADPQADWGADVMARIARGAVYGLAIWAALATLLTARLAVRGRRRFAEQWRSMWRGSTELPWATLLFVCGVLLVLGGIAVVLSGGYHLLGTDKVGEDVLYQALKSIRTGLVIGTLTTLVMLPAAVALGVMAGYFRGWVDDVIQYLYTTLNSIPGVLLIAAAILILNVYMDKHAEEFTSLVQRADLRLLFLCLILGVTSWTGLCRLLRGETLKLRELDYVQASQAFGVGNFTILYRHVLPNVLHIVLITVVLDFSGLVLAEAVLSYVNIGVDPTTNSWGNMINSARLELAREPIVWWSLVAAFSFMFTLVLAANLFSDVVRDAFDPRLRNDR
jgi:peptide/nickel transport system permease protein